jgi:HlyD family secretion protein
MMERFRKILLLVALLVVVGLMTWLLLPRPTPVSAERVERGHLEEYVEEEGRTTLRGPYVMSVPVAGFLRRVELEVGDAVEAGEVLFVVEPTPVPALDARTRRQAREAAGAAEAEVAMAEAEWETQQTEVLHAEREWERVMRLEEDDAIATAEIDRARRELDRARGHERIARANLEAARFGLRSAEAVLEVAEGSRAKEQEVVEVRSPVAGVILRRDRWSEGPIQSGERVMEVGDLSRLEVRVDLLSMDAVRVTSGMAVVLSRWGGKRELAGRVRRVEPSGFMRISALGVEEQRVAVWVTMTEPRADRMTLGEGYRVEARFILWAGENVLQVPTSALFRDGEAWAVFVVETGRAMGRTVEIGRRGGLRTEIRTGLDEGDWVVVHPGDRVQEGRRVRLEENHP